MMSRGNDHCIICVHSELIIARMYFELIEVVMIPQRTSVSKAEEHLGAPIDVIGFDAWVPSTFPHST